MGFGRGGGYHIYIYICMYMCIYCTCACVCACVHVYVNVYIYIYVCMYIYVHVCMYIHIYIYIYIYIYIHTCMRNLAPNLLPQIRTTKSFCHLPRIALLTTCSNSAFVQEDGWVRGVRRSLDGALTRHRNLNSNIVEILLAKGLPLAANKGSRDWGIRRSCLGSS